MHPTLFPKKLKNGTHLKHHQMSQKDLINASEVARFLGLYRFGAIGRSVSKSLLKITKLDELNKAYIDRAHLPIDAFIDSMFEHLGISYHIYEKDMERIPAKGPFITVSNHPLGAIDGMILLRTIIEKRPDFKVMANFLLNRVAPLSPYILAVNPFEDHKDAKSSFAGIKMSLAHIKAGNALGIFPAGEVSTMQDNGEIYDRPWEPSVMKLIAHAKVPVVPIYFDAHNSKNFYRAAKLDGRLRTAMLPRQITSQKHRGVRLRIGNPILPNEIAAHGTTEKLASFLKEKTYFLAKGFDDEHSKCVSNNNQQQLPIATAVAKDVLQAEIDSIKDKLLFSMKAYEIYAVKKKDAPNAVHEIGRLREITFREVGEGTNQSIDLDQYDEYYEHLFIYHKENREIAGAYRIGSGKEIFATHGIQGFYINELFEFAPPVHHILKDGLTLGRAFIAKDYQRSPLLLFMLWKAIVFMALKEDVKYLLGGVSISDLYTSFTKSIMIDFMMSNYYDNEVAQHVHARQPYIPDLSSEDKQLIEKLAGNDMKSIDKLIDEMNPKHGLKIPILLKKYIKQNTKLIAFNLDPKFNNVVDGLMYVSVSNLPEETLKATLKTYQEQVNK